MTVFWAVAAVLLLLAMWIVVGTLWRKPAGPRVAHSARQSNLAVLKAQLSQLDQDLARGAIDPSQHQLARSEIERRALEEESVEISPETAGSPRATLAMLLLAVPVLALSLYGALGNMRALDASALVAQGEPTPAQMEELLNRLAERMEKQPPGQVEDAEGWVMLGRTYAALHRFPEAERAFGRALQLTPNDAQLLADQADVLAMRGGRNLEGEPLRLIAQALKIDPSNLKALALAGSAAFERKDFAGAIKYWSAARAVAPQEGEFAQGLERGLADARAALGAGNGTGAPVGSTAAPAVATATTTSASAAAAQGSASISGRVSLSPALAARAAPGDTVFVFARAAEGPRMPLAILKRTAADLPLSFTLDDSMAMTPEFKLSKFPNVVVGARVSKSGNAMPQSGDLEGVSAPLNGRSSGIEIVIDIVRP